jgi:predicted deacetylase
VSFHDLHPGSRAACAGFLERLRGCGVTRVSLLVVPRWHGGPPLTQDDEFVAWLRTLAAAGHDICLHGFFHRAEQVHGGPWQQLIGRHYTQSEGEFFQIDHATALDRVRRGLDILANEARLPIVGFTPPAWLISDEGRAALVECGLHYTTTLGQVELLQRGIVLRAPTIVYSSRNAWRRAASRAWLRLWERVHRDAPLLRIAAHPADFAHAHIAESFYAHVQRAMSRGREAVTYRDLLPAGNHAIRSGPLAAA